MKFKTNQEEQNKEVEKMSKELYDGFLDLIQFEVDKLTLIESARLYFHKIGLVNYEKFFKGLYKVCKETKNCLIEHLYNNSSKEIPEFVIPQIVSFESFSENTKPFKMLAEMEDTFVEKINNLISISNGDRNWNSFYYLLQKLSKVDHICCRALSAVENKADVLALCEQHISEK